MSDFLNCLFSEVIILFVTQILLLHYISPCNIKMFNITAHCFAVMIQVLDAQYPEMY